MIVWPLHLIDELARRRSIIFLGSGVSKNSAGIAGKRPPLWKEFQILGKPLRGGCRCTSQPHLKSMKIAQERQ